MSQGKHLPKLAIIMLQYLRSSDSGELTIGAAHTAELQRSTGRHHDDSNRKSR